MTGIDPISFMARQGYNQVGAIGQGGAQGANAQHLGGVNPVERGANPVQRTEGYNNEQLMARLGQLDKGYLAPSSNAPKNISGPGGAQGVNPAEQGKNPAVQAANPFSTQGQTGIAEKVGQHDKRELAFNGQGPQSFVGVGGEVSQVGGKFRAVA